MSKNAKVAGMVMGIVSLVLDVIAFFVFGWLSFVGLGLGIPAIVIGAKDRSDGIGKASFITGIVGTVIAGIAVLIYILALAAVIR